MPGPAACQAGRHAVPGIETVTHLVRIRNGCQAARTLDAFARRMGQPTSHMGQAVEPLRMMLGFVVRQCAKSLGHLPTPEELAEWANNQRDAKGRYHIFGRAISIDEARIVGAWTAAHAPPALELREPPSLLVKPIDARDEQALEPRGARGAPHEVWERAEARRPEARAEPERLPEEAGHRALSAAGQPRDLDDESRPRRVAAHLGQSADQTALRSSESTRSSCKICRKYSPASGPMITKIVFTSSITAIKVCRSSGRRVSHP